MKNINNKDIIIDYHYNIENSVNKTFTDERFANESLLTQEKLIENPNTIGISGQLTRLSKIEKIINDNEAFEQTIANTDKLSDVINNEKKI